MEIMKLNKLVNRILRFALIILLFFMSFNLFGLKMYYLILIIILSIYFFKINYIDKTFILLLFFSVFYFYNYRLFFPVELSNVVVYLFSPWIFWFIGKFLIAKSHNNINVIYIIFSVVMIGLFLYGMLNFYKYISLYGFNYSSRISYDFWYNKIVTVTGSGLLLTGLTSLCLGYLFFGKRKKYLILSIFVVFLGLFASIIYRNRTLMIIFLILSFIGLITKLFSKNTINKFKNIYIFIAVILLLYLILDFTGLIFAALNSNLYLRFENTPNDRLELVFQFFKANPFQYPLGGKHITFSVGWVHNMWLDMWNEVGIIPFILFSIYTILVIKELFIIVFIEKNYELCAASFSLFSLLLNFAVEPVMSANHIFLPIFIVLSSLILNRNYLLNKKRGNMI